METTIVARRQCKKCHRGALDSRVKRAPLVKVALFWLPIKRYKCNYCDKKTYLFGSSQYRGEQNPLQVM